MWRRGRTRSGRSPGERDQADLEPGRAEVDGQDVALLRRGHAQPLSGRRGSDCCVSSIPAMTCRMKSSASSVSPPGTPRTPRPTWAPPRRLLLDRVGDGLGEVGGERLRDAGPGLRPSHRHVDGVRVLLTVEPPAASGHEVVHVVDVELVRGEAEQERRLAQHPQFRMRPDRPDHLAGRLEDLPGVTPVSGTSEPDHPGPGGGEQPARPRALDPRRQVLPAAPPRVEKVQHVAQRAVAEQQCGRALQAVPVLVGVGGDAGHAGQPKVEHRDVQAQLLTEREDEPAEAGVHVQADAARQGQFRQLRDRVDRPVAVAS